MKRKKGISQKEKLRREKQAGRDDISYHVDEDGNLIKFVREKINGVWGYRLEETK